MKRKRVLIADDDAATVDMLRVKFWGAPYDVDFAVDGLDALLKYKRAISDGKPYDLLVLDYYMPQYLGVTIIDMIRATGDFVACWLLTASNDDTLLTRARTSGGFKILLKPDATVQIRREISKEFGIEDPDAETVEPRKTFYSQVARQEPRLVQRLRNFFYVQKAT